MKRFPRIAGSACAVIGLVALLQFVLPMPARAPGGGKRSAGGRTIASLQEGDFDRRLLRLQLCYGVQLAAEGASAERRRVCKAILVNEAESATEKPGQALRAPLEFRCEESALERVSAEGDESIPLRPNAELAIIRTTLSRNLISTPADSSRHREALEACEFLTECKWAMRPASLSMRRLAACAVASNAMHRRLFLGELGGMLLGRASSRRPMVYPQLTETARR